MFSYERRERFTGTGIRMDVSPQVDECSCTAMARFIGQI
jgi:hypothetical protein